MTSNSYLASKPHYDILDGLRGVAALMVVAFHLFETYSKGPQYQIINHGYLAVDFFFVLSGFVIGYAYDDRWNRMSTWHFFKRRLIRLHPMLIMGGVVGILLYYFGDCAMFEIIGQTPVWKALIVFILGCILIPVPISLDVRGWEETFPLNGPCWTLFFEYIGNIIYALLFRRMGKMLLGLFVVFFALCTVSLTMNLDPLNVLLEDRKTIYTVIGGWSLSPDQLYIGFTRLLYPFFCGLLLSRIGKKITIKRGFWWCALFVILILVMPRVGGIQPENFWMNGVYESVCIILLFPLIVTIGAGSNVTGKRSAAVCNFLGNISYPLYVTHYPIAYLQMAWISNHADAPLGMHIFINISTYILAILVAYGSFKLYDEPVREWLKQHILMKKK